MAATTNNVEKRKKHMQGKLVRSYGDTVICVAFDPDETLFAVAGQRGIVFLYDIESGDELATIALPPEGADTKPPGVTSMALAARRSSHGVDADEERVLQIMLGTFKGRFHVYQYFHERGTVEALVASDRASAVLGPKVDPRRSTSDDSTASQGDLGGARQSRPGYGFRMNTSSWRSTGTWGGDSLGGVTHLVLDEVHERHTSTDVLLGTMRGLLARRPALRLVLMSATLNLELFSSFFGGARKGTGSGFGGTFLAAMVAQDDIVWGGTSGSKYAVCGVLKSHRESVQRGNAARNA